MYIDPLYLALVVPALLIMFWAQMRVKSTFKRFSTVYSTSGLTAQQVARRILDQNGLHNVQIQQTSGNLTDHYDPSRNIVALSDSVIHSTSIAAIGVAAHEVGHAIQHAQKYGFIAVRTALVPVANFASGVALPMAMLGIIMGIDMLATLGIIIFCAIVLFQLVTLPVEFNASHRALNSLESQQMLSSNELGGAKKVLSAAALTYVSGLLVAIANLLRLILLRNRNDN